MMMPKKVSLGEMRRGETPEESFAGVIRFFPWGDLDR